MKIKNYLIQNKSLTWSKDLNLRPKTLGLLEEITGKTLQNNVS